MNQLKGILTNWSKVNEFLIVHGFVSRDKSFRFTADGNYCSSLVARGKLVEGVHWEYSKPIRSVGYDGRVYYYKDRLFSLEAIENLYRDGFVDDPELWIAFDKQRVASDGTLCQWNVSDELHELILTTGCRWSGYSQIAQRKYYTAPSTAIARQGIAVAQRFSQSGLTED